MHRTILVDDEDIVLNGLVHHVSWDKYAITIVGAFHNGKDAYEFLCENEADLIITDVRMPYMDGIELVTRARALYPKVKTIFISAHADVEYLRGALKLDAVDYILKAIDPDELDHTLTRVVGILEDDKVRQTRFSEMEAQWRENLPILRNNRLTMLLRERLGDDEQPSDTLARELKLLNIPLDEDRHYYALVMHMVNRYAVISKYSEWERALLSLKIQRCCERALEENGSGVCFKDRPGEYILIVDAQDDNCEEGVLLIANHLHRMMKDDFGITIDVGLSDRFTGLNNVRDAYLSACEAIRMRYLLDDNVSISVNKYEEDAKFKQVRENACREILTAISAGDEEGVKSALEETLCSADDMDGDEQQNFFIFLLLLPARLLGSLKGRQKGPYASQRELLEAFLLCRGREEQITFIRRSHIQVMRILSGRAVPQPLALVEKVTGYIREHYMDRLSVNVLSEVVFLSPTYLCVLFKQQTGKTINEYITAERVRRAQEMLSDPNMFLYDVCYKVGYLSPSYFSRIFRKHTGLTPGEYREKICPGTRKDG